MISLNGTGTRDENGTERERRLVGIVLGIV